MIGESFLSPRSGFLCWKLPRRSALPCLTVCVMVRMFYVGEHGMEEARGAVWRDLAVRCTNGALVDVLFASATRVRPRRFCLTFTGAEGHVPWSHWVPQVLAACARSDSPASLLGSQQAPSLPVGPSLSASFSLHPIPASLLSVTMPWDAGNRIPKEMFTSSESRKRHFPENVRRIHVTSLPTHEGTLKMDSFHFSGTWTQISDPLRLFPGLHPAMCSTTFKDEVIFIAVIVNSPK